MSGETGAPRAAYIEDYNEDAHTTIPETRQTANIAAKRSKPDIHNVKSAPEGRDEASDSGYSSHTAATAVSAGSSSQGSKDARGSFKSSKDITSIRRIPTNASKRSQSRPRNLPKATIHRSNPKTIPADAVPRKNCNCDDCRNEGRLSTSATEPLPTPPSPSQKPGPRYEVASNRPAGAIPLQDVPFLRTVVPRPRPTINQQTRPSRPASFHAGVRPDSMFMPPIFVDRQPPPTYNSPVPYIPPPSFPAPASSGFVTPIPTLPGPRQVTYAYGRSPYESLSHPRTQDWPPDQYTQVSQRPNFFTPSPIVEYQPAPIYTTITPAQLKPQPTGRGLPYQRIEKSPSAQLPTEYLAEHDEDSHRMPPPTTKRSIPGQPRPPMRHASTTSDAHTKHRKPDRHETTKDEKLEDRPIRQQPIEQSHLPSRRPSVASRPSVATTASSESRNSKNDVPVVKDPDVTPNATLRSRRRPVSYYGVDSSRDLEQKVEAYQKAKTESAQSVPLTKDSLSHVLQRRPTLRKTGESEISSRASGSSEGKVKGSSRTSMDKRSRGGSDVKTRKDSTEDSLSMRFNASHGVNLDFKGDSVEGRTISLRQSREVQGEVELNIGGKNSSPKSKDGREKDKSVRRYSYLGGDKGVQEIEYSRTKTEVIREDDRELQRTTTQSRSRRSSRAPNRDRSIMERVMENKF
ncbi:hypothetical protein MMC09_002150 [Bachmanniomyces sp. S44760]|nr:hypothetical protein [Bachmanniomyces sp. S44760]